MNGIKNQRGIRVTQLDDSGEIMQQPKAIKPTMRPKIYRETLPSDEQPLPENTYEPHRVYCIDVCNHIVSCPLCSKFYSTDKSMYILAIVLISIICIILIKKLVEKQG